VTNAGGAGALMTDYLVERGYNIEKPVDLLGTALAGDYRKAFEKLKKSDADSVVAILTPQSMSEPEQTADEIIKFSKYKSVIALFLGGNSIRKAKQMLERNKIQCFTDI